MNVTDPTGYEQAVSLISAGAGALEKIQSLDPDQLQRFRSILSKLNHRLWLEEQK